MHTIFTGRRLKWKFTIIFVLLITVPTLLVSVLVLTKYDEILRKQFEMSTQNNLRAVELNITDKIKAIQDMSDYMIYKSEFRLFMTTPFTPQTMKSYYDYRQQVEGIATFQLISKSYIKSISFEGLNGNELHIGEPVGGAEGYWNNLASALQGKPLWTDSYPILSGWSGPKRVISMIRQINSYEELTEPVGRITVRLDEEEFRSILASIVPSGGHTAFILKPDNTVLLHDDDALIGRTYPDQGLLQQLHDGKDNTFSYRQGDTSYVVIHRTMGINGWQLVTIVPQELIIAQTYTLKSSVALLLIATVILSILAFIGFYFTIIRPILAISRQTARVSMGDFEAHVEVRWHDEIGELARRFNSMVVTIKELIDYKYKLEIRQRESDLNLLMRQIDPHFLYNTLDMIRWTARMENAPETSQLIETLSRFFRISLTRGKRWTSVKDELLFVKSYLELQQKRLGDKLKYTIYMEAQLEEAAILNKVIQPLVENSIKHGFKLRVGGLIQVRAYQVDNDIWIDVIDYGKGFTAEQRDRIHDAFKNGSDNEEWMGHAMSNIHERVTIVSGKAYGLQIVDVPVGSCVRLRMPLSAIGTRALTEREREGDSNAD